MTVFTDLTQKRVSKGDNTELNSDLTLQAQSKLDELFELAQQRLPSPWYKKSLQKPTLQLNQRGKIAGSAVLQKNVIKLNFVLYQSNADYFLNHVIAHELAHILVYQIYGTRKKPHGLEWKQIMLNVFGIQPSVTHSLDTSVLKIKTYDYQCDCQTISLSVTRHNKIKRGTQSYQCKRCKSTLRPI